MKKTDAPLSPWAAAADALLTPARASQYLRERHGMLRATEGSLAMRRYTKSGPPYQKLGSNIFYRPSDIDAWIEAQLQKVPA